MFKHVVQIGDEFYVRRWRFGWQWWDQRANYWWLLFKDERTAFSSEQEAIASYWQAQPKIRKFF